MTLHTMCATQPLSPATEPMIQRMVTSALFAGFAAALLAGLLHFVFVQKLILLGEQYESGALVHFKGVGGAADPAASNAGAAVSSAAPDAGSAKPEAATGGAAAGSTTMAAQGMPPPDAAEDSFSRNAWTVLFYNFGYFGYALVMLAGFGLAETFGKRITLREGLLWGIAGYAAFQLAPAMGLAPELPGIMAADLTARKIWWLGTAICTAAALGLLGYGRGMASVIGAVALLALPHLIGAPELESYSGVAPPELASTFAARVLGVGLMVWATLGAVAGWLWSRPQ